MTESLRVKVVAGSHAGRVLIIPGTGATIGRGEWDEIRLDEPSVSREHCCIYQHRDAWYVQDMDSQNGTFVNGKKITKERLKGGDRIGLGVVVLRVPRDVPVATIVGGAVGVVLLVAFLVWLLRVVTAKPPSAEPDPNAQSSDAPNEQTGQPTPADPLHKYLQRKHNPDLLE